VLLSSYKRDVVVVVVVVVAGCLLCQSHHIQWVTSLFGSVRG